MHVIYITLYINLQVRLGTLSVLGESYWALERETHIKVELVCQEEYTVKLGSQVDILLLC